MDLSDSSDLTTGKVLVKPLANIPLPVRWRSILLEDEKTVLEILDFFELRQKPMAQQVEVESNRRRLSFLEKGPKQTTTPYAHPDNHLRRMKWNGGDKVRIIRSLLATVMSIHFT